MPWKPWGCAGCTGDVVVGVVEVGGVVVVVGGVAGAREVVVVGADEGVVEVGVLMVGSCGDMFNEMWVFVVESVCVMVVVGCGSSYFGLRT